MHLSASRSDRRRPSAIAAAAVLLASAPLSACRTPGVVGDLLGADRAPRTPTCLVVAPALMPADEVDADVAAVVDEAAKVHGSLIVIVARGPSASAFTHVRFDDAAHGGSFASRARSAGRRNADAARWSDAAVVQIRAAIAADAESTGPAGLDLFGGLAACARSLPSGPTPRTIAVVSTGVHRTVTLDLVRDPSAAAPIVAEHIAAVAPAPTRLVLLGLGRVDMRANSGPAARSVTEPVTQAWTDACAARGTRCSTLLPTITEVTR